MMKNNNYTIKLIHVVDADEKPSLVYAYERILWICKTITSIFKER